MIWQEWLAADTQYEYFVRCPHCGAEWRFAFGQLRFDSSSPEAARSSAVYVCPDCGGVIGDGEKTAMVQAGGMEGGGGSGAGARWRFGFRPSCRPGCG